MKLVLARHCETDWNTKENKLQGHADIILNENGRSQAKVLGEKLKGFGISSIISSDLKRASETAKIISEVLRCSSVKLDKRLRECNFGTLEGTPRNEALKIYESTGCYKGPREYNFRQFHGEDRNIVLGRQLELFAELKSRASVSKSLPLIVGHGTSLNTVLYELGYEANLQREEYRIIEY